MSNILLIDDEPDILRVLAMSLKADGHAVFTAPNGNEAILLFQQERPEIVVTDIKMPGMNGIEVLREIKGLDDETEVIIITGHGDIDSAIEALQHGASDFINKPVRDEALTIALRRAAEKIEIKRRLKEYTVDLENKVEIAVRELRRQSNFQAKLIRSSNDGIVATDHSMQVVVFNPGAERIFGYRQEEVIGRMDASEIYTDQIFDLFRQAMAGGNAKREFPWRETAIRSRDGQSIPVRFSGSVLLEKQKTMGGVAFFQDLREIKRLERELLKAERLAAVGQTVAGLSHGIKNILHGLKGGSYLVDIGIKRGDTEKLKSGWGTIKRNIARTSDLVMDLLSYSKERQPEFEECRPNEIAGDVCDLLQARADENGIELVRRFDPSVGEVSMDPRTVHRSLMNLVSNAIDACLFDENTQKRWTIMVRTALETDDRIRFEVEDNGAGMSKEVRNRLFTSFFSTKGHRGTGLGLMVTRKMVEEHGGTITVSSELGKGTVFTMRLPFNPSPETGGPKDKTG
jgi:PAS domain S-box-containing protein